jgi:cytochrome c oxidase cbb3-type subunit 3
MADFIGGFWNVFIAVITLGGIAALFWLNLWMTTARRKRAEPKETTGHVWDGDLKEYNNPLPRWWLNLFYITLVFGLVYLALYPGLGSFAGVLEWTSQNRYQQELAHANEQFGPLYEQYLRSDIKALARNDEALKTGERLFVNYCTTCHGSDARGAVGYPNLRDQDWLWGGDPDTIKATILDGRTGGMPPWDGVLGRSGTFNVAEYVLSLSGKRAVNQNAAAAGKKTFATLCAACHGDDARGNPALGAPNLTDDVWLYGGSQRTVRESIELGRSGRMPAHREFLGEAKAHLLAAYVYSLSQSELQGGRVEPKK